MLYLVLALGVPVLLLGAVIALERYERIMLQPPVTSYAGAPEPGGLPEQRVPVSPVLRSVADARPLSVASLDLAR